MGEFEKAFSRLNKKQLEAVKQIDGPLLVIAGPGTGKTQLLGMRVGHILKVTDSLPSGILCLTFTEAAAAEMRERLIKLIGTDAYSVTISTYHAYGAEIMRRNPEYFEDSNRELVEELRANMILRDIIARLPYSSPLKFADNYIRDIDSFISDCKQALLTPEDVSEIATDNLGFIKAANKLAEADLAKLGTVSKAAVPVFHSLFSNLKNHNFGASGLHYQALSKYCLEELEEALSHFASTGKTTLLTQWKKAWLEKNAKGEFIIAGKRHNQRLLAAAEIYKTYQQSLDTSRLYDYDDMILRAISALEKNQQFKYSLAENYQYILLDEFQDTNRAQMRLVELLTDHPVHEGRPNVMAVGDDDQAIYAFQGADHANMAYFADHYKDTAVVSLEDNYRSHKDIISVSTAIAAQIDNRLHENFNNIKKTLTQANNDLPSSAVIYAREFKSEAAQYEWVSEEIKKLVEIDKLSHSDIAVLAPKHKYLMPLLPFLRDRKIPIRYEKRENILDEPIIRQLEQMGRLVQALSRSDEARASEIWPEVISYDFWDLPTEKIWRISWETRRGRQPWTKSLLEDKATHHIALFFLRLADVSPLLTLEEALDALIGLPNIGKRFKLPITSPMFEHYFGKQGRADPAGFTRLISRLNRLRSGLRDWQHGAKGPLKLEDFIDYLEGHRAASLNILDNNPYFEATQAVNLLTAYGAKGREFRAVFIICAQDEVWGSSSRNQGNRLSLPANLNYIRYQGASEDERLRLLFVAASRAMTHLFFTSYSQTLAGKRLTRLKYLNISEKDDGKLTSGVLPEPYCEVNVDQSETISPEAALNHWTDRHLPPLKQSLADTLRPQLERYQLSATHLNQFTDLVDAGPEIFFLQCLLGFSSAPTITSIYGTAIHNTLRSIGGSISKDGKAPDKEQVIQIFSAQLNQMRLGADDYQILHERGAEALGVWTAQSAGGLSSTDKYEYDFSGEAVFLDGAHMSGKVDRLIIDKKNKALAVLDYKTGQAYSSWDKNVLKLHKFRQQLMVYKLLVENSAGFKGYTVSNGIIEFVEPDEEGNIVRLELSYDSGELDDMKLLISSVWKRIKSLNFPDTHSYPNTLAGIRAFEKFLVDGD